MIINHKYQFIFIHIQKTAGTSITNALYNLFHLINWIILQINWEKYNVILSEDLKI